MNFGHIISVGSIKGWRWIPGMALRDGSRLVLVFPTFAVIYDGHYSPFERRIEDLGEPDWSDKATGGLLPDVVRELYRDPLIYVCPRDLYGHAVEWEVRTSTVVHGSPQMLRAATELDAWLAALNAAPVKQESAPPEGQR